MGRWRRAAYGYACCLLIRKGRATDPRRVHRAVPEADRGISRSPNRGRNGWVHTHAIRRLRLRPARTDPGVELLGRQLIAEKIHALLPKFHGHGYPQRLERRHNEISAYCSRTGRTYPHADALRPQANQDLNKSRQADGRSSWTLWITLALKGYIPAHSRVEKPLWITISFIPRLRSGRKQPRHRFSTTFCLPEKHAVAGLRRVMHRKAPSQEH